MILKIGFLLSVAFGHYLIGWQMTLVMFALGLGFIFDEHHITISFVMGLLLHGAGLLINYIFYFEATTQTLQFIGRISGGIPTVFIPIFTVLFPSMVYGLAGFFSSNLYYIYQQISNETD